MNRSVVNVVSMIRKTGGAERHFLNDKKMDKAVTGLESESVTAHEVSNNNMVSLGEQVIRDDRGNICEKEVLYHIYVSG